MKTILCTVFLFSIIFSLFSQTPTYEFITDPVDIMENYYDYMPGGYTALPVQIEDDGGLYIVYHAREAATSIRHIYRSYIDTDGNVANIATIPMEDVHEGFPGIDLDPVTGDPFVAWHGDYDVTSADVEVIMSYDLYHQGSPGLWRTPFIVFGDNTPSANMPDDEFIWPEVHIGPSPIPDKRRVYVIGKNMDSSPISGNSCENVLIGYADFNVNDLNIQSELEFTYRTIELMDQWHNSQDAPRPNFSCSVSDDGKIALMGYISMNEGPDSLAVFLNENFGEGDFEYYSQEAHYNVWNPTPGTPHELYFAPYLCDHQNSIFHDNNSQISFLGNMNILIYPDTWYQDEKLMYPKVYTYDVLTHEFSFYDLYIEGAYPADDTPMIPWDLDEDGIVDSINANGEPVWVEGWPIYFNEPNMAYNENNFKLTKNEENGWVAVVWNDGLKARLAEEGEPGYEAWQDKPEVAICISADNGESWSQPIFLNANETPQFADMIPEYVYPGDKIEDLGNDHGKLHLFFLDDYEYGSNFTGGMQKYCSIEIDFGDFTESPEITMPATHISLTNYPNPFNPSTTISFELNTTDAQDAKIEIYNLKGQKVKNFPVILSGVEGREEVKVVWDGTDQTGKHVSSGVYFAKLKAGNRIATRKMLLMK
jgi:Secretion system C-terminal sorting domain